MMKWNCLALCIGSIFSPWKAVTQQAAPATVHIEVDLDRPLGADRHITSWFGYDEANYTTTADGRRLLGELHDLSPVPVYVRAHHLLTSGDGTPELKWSSTGVYREDADGTPHYNFTILDGIFDAYLQAGVRPMVELGFTPLELAAQLPDKPGQPYHIAFPKGDVLAGAANNPPKDFAKWGELCRVVTAHLVERYGRERVATWYFEVWNEPDIAYWHGTVEQYCHLYDTAVAGVRKALPGARVGGPATTGPAPQTAPGANDKPYLFLKAFLEHVQQTQVPLDFISFHVKGRPTVENGEVVMGSRHELEDADRGFALIASYPEFRSVPIILSEADPEGCAACSSRSNPTNGYRNGALYAAYTAANMARVEQLAERRGVNLLGAVSWAFEFEGHDTFEGFRVLQTNGIDEPVLNTFRMAGRMRGTRVTTRSDGAVPLDTALHGDARSQRDVEALADRDASEATIMLWNYRDRQNGEAAPIDLMVAGLPPGTKRVMLQAFTIDHDHSNAYTAWQAIGSPAHPSAVQTAQLQAAGQLQADGASRIIEAKDGVLQWKAVLEAESVTLLRLQW